MLGFWKNEIIVFRGKVDLLKKVILYPIYRNSPLKSQTRSIVTQKGL